MYLHVGNQALSSEICGIGAGIMMFGGAIGASPVL